LAFLGLTTEAYPSNLDAIAAFLPDLTRGGVLAVDGNLFKAGQRDAVDEFLRNEHIALLLPQITAGYRIGVRP
jgi:hypothetical protein